MQHLTAASLEGLLVMVAVMLISAVSNWLKKRAEETEARSRGLNAPRAPMEERAPTPPVEGMPRRGPAPMTDWEAELRRLLEGDTSKPAGPVAPQLDTPPTVVVVQPTQPIRPVVIARGEPVAAPVPLAESEGTLEEPMALPPAQSPVRFPTGRPSLEAAPAPAFDLASMNESRQAYGRGSAMEPVAAARLASAVVLTQTAKPLQVLRREVIPAEVKALSATLGRREEVRRAFLTSVLLGPPKAFETETARPWL